MYTPFQLQHPVNCLHFYVRECVADCRTLCFLNQMPWLLVVRLLNEGGCLFEGGIVFCKCPCPIIDNVFLSNQRCESNVVTVLSWGLQFFSFAIRGNHVYKSTWLTSIRGQHQSCSSLLPSWPLPLLDWRYMLLHAQSAASIQEWLELLLFQATCSVYTRGCFYSRCNIYWRIYCM